MKYNIDIPIDFVITWVDQSDEKWLSKFNYFSNNKKDSNNERFRDYNTLRYLFRSIDKFAPWVRNVFLVTDEQIPEWLKLDNPKIKVVFHDRIIPSKYLPTFNSNVIDLGLVNIPELSDYFVYFNDDMFLNAPVKKTDFFSITGKPKDTLAFNTIMPSENFDHIFVNNISLINSLYNKKKVMKSLFFKLFNFKNMEFNFLNMLLAPFPRFSRFVDPHIPISFKKDSIQSVMDTHPEIVESTNVNRFRSKDDYSIWLFRYIEMLRGNFSVRYAHFGKGYQLYQIEQISEDIKFSKHKVLNINDSEEILDSEFRKLTKSLVAVFDEKLNEKSSFEK
ncbi:sugar phosphotransferase [Levilactobacillus parabrevis]|uniref:stealth family protein n=1 Tax=Levilactobacillus parabrevis TaxID=357278 RepID=UPI0021A5F03A|nr:stealth family protein [Levilactobacillus parabrevis]MCT4490881.1 sugar phosphotransferase [Levilactobacillus parabrevis]